MLAPSNLAISLKPQAALLLGDTQYDTGNLSAFEPSYAKAWGRKERKISAIHQSATINTGRNMRVDISIISALALAGVKAITVSISERGT
jgi:hypothetical protein